MQEKRYSKRNKTEVSRWHKQGVPSIKTSRSSLGYQSKKDDNTLIDHLSKLSELHPREGFWKSYYRLRNDGKTINHKRLHRVYKQMGLSLRRKTKKRLPARIKEPITVPSSFTDTWSIDFMSDALSNGSKFRSFNVIDDYNEYLGPLTSFILPTGPIHNARAVVRRAERWVWMAIAIHETNDEIKISREIPKYLNRLSDRLS